MTTVGAKKHEVVANLNADRPELGLGRLIDLSQEIYEGMPLYPIHQKTFRMVNQTHEQSKLQTGSSLGFEAHNLLISEHGGTHADAIYEFDPKSPTLSEMPLGYFYGSAICLDVSSTRHPDYLEPEVLEAALEEHGLDLREPDIVLLYTGHYNRTYPSPEYAVGPYAGLPYDGVAWLAERGVVNIGVDSPSIDHTDDTEFRAHAACVDYEVTNTENLAHLDRVAGHRFTFLALPLPIREGTGSPVRAVAFLQE